MHAQRKGGKKVKVRYNKLIINGEVYMYNHAEDEIHVQKIDKTSNSRPPKVGTGITGQLPRYKRNTATDRITRSSSSKEN